jgi:hypothetical protein
MLLRLLLSLLLCLLLLLFLCPLLFLWVEAVILQAANKANTVAKGA